MGNLSNYARPYALAAFDYAQQQKDLTAWMVFLDSAAIIAKHPSVVALLNNPEANKDQAFTLFSSMIDPLTTAQKNFLLILSQNKRLILLPAITASFKAHYAAYQKVSDVRVVTAITIDNAYKQKLTQALTKRIEREVALHYEVNPDILGGAIIHIGDRVIDGSIRGKLTRLLENMMS